MAVTDADLKKIYDTTRDTSSFIETAALIVNEELAGKGLSAERLDKITLYLSAHFLCLTDENGGLRRSRLGESDESYRVPGDKEVGLSSTRFGQQAMLLDPTATLAGMTANKGLKALFETVGGAIRTGYENVI